MNKKTSLLLSLSLCTICGIVAFPGCTLSAEQNKEQILQESRSQCSPKEQQLIEKLYSRNPLDRGCALYELISFPNAAKIAYPRVEELLSDNLIYDPFKMARVGEEAAFLLSYFDDEKAFDIAVAATTNRSTVVRRNAAWAFARGENGRAATNAVPILKKLLTDKDRTVRDRAARELSGVDMSMFNYDLEAWIHWYENSACYSASRQAYAYFAIYEQNKQVGPKVYAPLDSAKISAYTNEYYHVIWAPGAFGRILSIEKIKQGKTLWLRTFGPGQSVEERDRFYLD